MWKTFQGQARVPTQKRSFSSGRRQKPTTFANLDSLKYLGALTSNWSVCRVTYYRK